MHITTHLFFKIHSFESWQKSKNPLLKIMLVKNIISLPVFRQISLSGHPVGPRTVAFPLPQGLSLVAPRLQGLRDCPGLRLRLGPSLLLLLPPFRPQLLLETFCCFQHSWRNTGGADGSHGVVVVVSCLLFVLSVAVWRRGDSHFSLCLSLCLLSN